MARNKGSANFSGSLEVLAGAPLDAREVVPTKADLLVSANFPYPYIGMRVSVQSENKVYLLTAADVTNEANWKEIGKIIIDDELSTTSENPVQNKVITNTLNNCVKKSDITIKVFDTTQSYSRSDLVWYENKLYIFKNSKTAGAWDSTKVNEVTDLGSVFQTKNLQTPLIIGSIVQGDLEDALSSINTIAQENSTSIETLNTSKQDKLTAGTNIQIDASNNISASVPIIVSNFAKSDLYDSSEKIIGCWTNGKPIYQKIVQMGPCQNTQSEINNFYSVGASIDEVISYRAYCKWSTSDYGFFSAEEWNNSESGEYIRVYILNNSSANANKIQRQYKGNLSFCTDSFAVVQYTKTTDSANSFNYANAGEYSSNEKIVGKWVDGKTIYQKTINCGAGPNNTTKSIGTGISGIVKVVSMEAIGLMRDNTVTFTLNYSPDNTGTAQVDYYYYKPENKIYIISGHDVSGYDIYVTLKYTKN